MDLDFNRIGSQRIVVLKTTVLGQRSIHLPTQGVKESLLNQQQVETRSSPYRSATLAFEQASL